MWKSHTALGGCQRDPDPQNTSEFQTVFVLHYQAPKHLLSSRTGRKTLGAQLCVCPHKHLWEQKSAQPNRPLFTVLNGIVLPMALLPSPCLVPLLGSALENFTFHLMEDWHQRKPFVTQDFSQSLVLKSMYLLKTNVGIKVVRTLWPFK